jgi:hypothetical protein
MYSTERKGFLIKSREFIPAGVQLSLTYGRKSNQELLLHYGFILQDNPIKEKKLIVRFDMAAMHDNPEAADAAQLLTDQFGVGSAWLLSMCVSFAFVENKFSLNSQSEAQILTTSNFVEH